MSSSESPNDTTSDTGIDENKSIATEAADDQNSAASSNEPAAKPPKPNKDKTARASSFSSVIFFLFILILLAVSAGGYYYWQHLQTTLNQFASDLEYQTKKLNIVTPRVDQARHDILTQQQQLEQLSTKYQQQLEKLAEFNAAQKTMMQSMQNVFDITHRNQRLWLLAEVSYLLSLANQRLIISRDIQSSIAALKSANNRLHDLADPSLLKLRKQIADEIASLLLLKKPDINGIAFSLDNAISMINLLPFKSAKQKTIESSKQAKTIELAELDKDSYFSPLWHRIKNLVTIKKHSREIKTTETTIEKNDIDNQVRYRIEAARLALINKNSKIFNHEMLTTSELLSLYYDSTDNRVSQLINDLKAFSQVNLVPELPDITASWKQLQGVIAVNNAQKSLNIEKNKSKGKSIQ